MSALAPELLLAALVVTSLATGGLLGLWAATSPRHWFVRTLVVFAVLTPLLYRPIYEPFVTLLVEVGVVVLGVTVWRRNWPSWKFSIADMLMLTVPVAVLVASAMRAPEHHLELRIAIHSLGVTGGGITLLTAWFVNSFKVRLRDFIIVLPTFAMLTICWAISDYMPRYAIFDICERACDCYGSWRLEQIVTFDWRQLRHAFGSCAATSLILGGTLLLCRPRREGPSGMWLQTVQYVAAIAVAAYPVVMAVELLTPLSVPNVKSGGNAFDELVEIGKRFRAGEIVSIGSGKVENRQQLAREVKAADEDYRILHALLQRPLQTPANHYLQDYNTRASQRFALEALATALAYRSQIARAEGELDAAMAAIGDLLRLIRSIEASYFEQSLDAVADAENLLLREVRHLALQLEPDSRRELCELVASYCESRSGKYELVQHEFTKVEIAWGWGGHLGHKLLQWGGESGYAYGFVGWARDPNSDPEYLRSCALTALTAMELALSEYHREYGEFPAALHDLVPEFLPRCFSDPYSDVGETFVYRSTPQGFSLYSLWEDGDDDGGRSGATNSVSDGDLSLEAYFADE